MSAPPGFSLRAISDKPVTPHESHIMKRVSLRSTSSSLPPSATASAVDSVQRRLCQLCKVLIRTIAQPGSLINRTQLTSTTALALAVLGVVDNTRASDKVIWVSSSPNSIKSADLDGSNTATTWPASAGPDVVIDTITGNIYWGDNSVLPGRLMMASNDGTGTPTVVATTVAGERIHYIALDPSGTGTAYWCDRNTLHTYRAVLPNGAPTLISPSPDTIRGLALDLRPDRRHLYSYDGASLWRSDLPNGANRVQVANPIGDGSAGEFALDPCTDSVYVIGKTFPHPGTPVPYIRRASLSSGPSPSLSNITDILSGDNQVGTPSDTTGPDIALDLRARRMYWTSMSNNAVEQIRSAGMNGSGAAVIVTDPTVGGAYMGITLFLADYGCPEPGDRYCFPGYGPYMACPCSNAGFPNNGCASSFNAGGAHLTASGSVEQDDVVLIGSGMQPTGLCIFLQGDAIDSVGFQFGDGVTCTGGSLVRLRGVALSGGSSSFPVAPETITLSQRGDVVLGSGRIISYTAFYRNAAAAFCPPFTFNTSNSYRITW